MMAHETTGLTPTQLRELADQLDADTRYGPQARLLLWALLTGIAQRMEREGR